MRVLTEILSNTIEGFIVLRPLGDRVIIEVAKEEEKLWEGSCLLQQLKKNLKQEPSLQSVKDAR